LIDVWLDKNAGPGELKRILAPYDEGGLRFEIA